MAAKYHVCLVDNELGNPNSFEFKKSQIRINNV